MGKTEKEKSEWAEIWDKTFSAGEWSDIEFNPDVPKIDLTKTQVGKTVRKMREELRKLVSHK